MIAILFIIVCGLVLCYAAWQYSMVPEFSRLKKSGKDMTPLFILLAAGLVVRIICACIYKGHNTDMACFTGWARIVFENGMGNFYSSAGFTDYPPGYMYILYVIGAIRQLFSLDGTGYYLLIKLPAIIADIVSGYLIYKIASKKLSSGISIMLAALYLFNPAVITDSSLWGQVDSVYTLFIALMVWLISERKMEISYFIFAICILIKPQAFIYTPLVIFGIIENYIYPEFKSKELLKSIGIGIGAIAFMVLLAMPFNFMAVLEQYTKTLSEYPYFTINALNLWGMLGLNWDKLTTAGNIIGYIILVLIVAASAYVFFKSKNKSKYYYTAAVLALFTFMLSTKMHERYGFPVMIFLLLAIIESKNIHNFALYTIVSLSQFYNIAWVLFIYETDTSKYAFYSGVNIASAINMLVLAYMIYVTYKMYVKNGIAQAMITPESSAAAIGKSASKATKAKTSFIPAPSRKTSSQSRTGFKFQRTEPLASIARKDLAIIAAIMVVYSAVALYDLGDMSAPETGVKLSRSAVSINLGEQKSVTNMRVFIGDTPVTAENPLLISFRDSEDSQDERTQLITAAPAMQWLDISGLNENAQFVTLTPAGENNLSISEVSILSGSEELTPSNTGTETVSVLFDETDSAQPVTGVTLSAPVSVITRSDMTVNKLDFFLGPKELNKSDRRLNITAIDNSGNVTYSQSRNSGSVFRWEEQSLSASAARVIIATAADELYLNEVQLSDSEGNAIAPASVTGADADLLFDEQDLVPERETFRNSTYFDEIYHARTAYENIHHMPVYEWTHPPLGKIFISVGIRIFGMNPFGWRIAGTIFGIFMIPIIYIFAKKLLKKQWLTVITCLLFTFDFMHFAQTRIATIDVYVTFFIMLMYLFMFKYYMMSFNDTPLKKTLVPLALCGTMMGLGIASKWTGIYAGAGLAVIFFFTLFRRWREYSYALSRPAGETDGIKHKDVIDNFWHNIAVTLGWCVIFFVIVPAIIYGLSYVPSYLVVPGSQGLKTIIDNQRSMLTYHGKTVLGSTHPYSSRWYEWIIMKRPIWYYSGTVSDGVKEGISAFGNPLVWWLGIPAFFWMIYNAITKRDKVCLFFIIAYLAQLVPWMPIERLTFIYHYFPCVPFITLMIGYSIKLLYDEAKHKNWVKTGAFVYVGLVIVLFIMFYPVLSGHSCSVWYAQHFLKWFKSWVLL